jgi:hypothetical protein
MFHPMSQAPTDPVLKAVTCPNEPLTYRVWHHRPYYSEDPTPWKCVAAFQYLQEALDYLSHIKKATDDIVFQTPSAVCTLRRMRELAASLSRCQSESSQAFQIIAGPPRRRPAPQYVS